MLSVANRLGAFCNAGTYLFELARKGGVYLRYCLNDGIRPCISASPLGGGADHYSSGARHYRLQLKESFMDFEVEHDLIVRFPSLFGFTNGVPDDAKWGIDCGNGWGTLIRSMCAALENRERDTGRAIRFSLIQQKMGVLQCTLIGFDDFTRGVVDLAHWMSYSTCEICGNQGRVGRGTKGWVRVLCPVCRAANPD